MSIDDTNQRPAEPAALPERTDLPAREVRTLLSLARRAAKHLRKKLPKQQEELVEAGSHLRYRQLADSLLAGSTPPPRGTVECEVVNVHTQQAVAIRLNPKFDARQNAELLYKKARKGERGLEVVRRNVEETERELAQVERVCGDLEPLLCPSPAPPPATAQTIAAARTVLMELGLLPKQQAMGKRPEIEPTMPFRRLIVENWQVYVGKTDAQNDELTVHFAKPTDLWFHVAAHAGSHVIIRRDRNGDLPPKTVIAKVAALAAWFSKARHSSYVDVHYAEKRYVHKRRHAPKGEVVMTAYKTIRVSPVDPQVMFREHTEGRE